MYDTGARAEQQRQPRSRAGALATSATAAVGAGLSVGAGFFGLAPITPPVLSPATARYDVALADYTGTTTPTPNIWDGIVALVDASGIGNKTLPDFLPPTATLGDVLSPSGLSLSTNLNAAGVWDLLGLQNYTVADILKDIGLPTSMTIDGLADKWQMANVPIDFFATPLGIPSTQTTMGLAHRFSIAHDSINDIVKLLGLSPTETLSQTTAQFNLYDAYVADAKTLTNTHIVRRTLGALLGTLNSYAGIIGAECSNGTEIKSTTTIDAIIACLNLDNNKSNPTISGSTSVEKILDSQHFSTTGATTGHTNEIIGNWTIGQILNFTSSTTIGQFIDNLHVNFNVKQDTPTSIPTNPVTVNGSVSGGATIIDSAQDKGSAAVPSGSLLSSLPVLGHETIGAFLNWIGVPTSQSLASLLSNEIMIGSTPLGQSTIGSALDTMLLNPSVLPGYPTTQLLMTTPLTTFFTAMGGPLATDTIDQLLHITPP